MANAFKFRQIKRIGFSLLLGFGFTIAYAVLMVVIAGVELFPSDFVEILGFPLAFVYYIYKLLGGNSSSEFIGKHLVLFFSGIFIPPALLYSAVAYFMLTLIAKYSRPDLSDNLPPLPPENFNQTKKEQD